MNLSEYLNDHDLETFATAVSVHVSTVYRWISGETTPRVKQIAAIEKETKGKVRFRDFVAKN